MECEMCDSKEARRREDNMYLCDECNDVYPIGDDDDD